MTPDEQKTLARAHRKWNIVLVIITFTAVVALMIGIFGGTAGYPGNAQHLLGQSTKTTATVTSIEKVDFCSRGNRDQYTLDWQEDGINRTETVGRCGDPWDVGDEITIWSTDDEPFTESPWVLRSAFGALFLGLGLTTVVTLRIRGRIRKTIAKAIRGTWQPQVYSTISVPGSKTFHMNSPHPVNHRPIDWTRVLYKPKETVRPAADIPGTLYIDGFKNGRPQGLSLHETADGQRVWRWHGRMRHQKLPTRM